MKKSKTNLLSSNEIIKLLNTSESTSFIIRKLLRDCLLTESEWIYKLKKRKIL